LIKILTVCFREEGSEPLVKEIVGDVWEDDGYLVYQVPCAFGNYYINKRYILDWNVKENTGGIEK